MSTIVYRDGVMAADTRAYSGSRTPIGAKMKIHRLKDGSLFGVSTPVVGLSETLRDWMDEGADRECHPSNLDFHALHVRPDGQVFYYNDGVWPSGPLVAPYFAIGSGEQYALGALVTGASAVQAVEIACQLDAMSALPVAAKPLHEPAAE